MDDRTLARYIDLTLLDPAAGTYAVAQFCDRATALGVYGVCVQPCQIGHVALRLRALGSDAVPIAVIGFPHGANRTRVKAFEAEQAVHDGARELDMVLNIGAFRESLVVTRRDIAAVVEAARDAPVKVIIESAALTEQEIREACILAHQAGARFVKTSTGFHKAGGATLEAVRLMYDVVGGVLGIKASGGIMTREQALAFIAAGATRLGCSDVSRILGLGGAT